VDVLFANAGIGNMSPLGAISQEQFDKVFDVNVKGTLFTVQKALPLMRAGRSIILTGQLQVPWGRPPSACTARQRPLSGICSNLGAGPEGYGHPGQCALAGGYNDARSSQWTGERPECKKLFLPARPVRRHLNVWATRTKRLPWPCSSPPMTAALWQEAKYSLMAVWRRSDSV
jgi:hypothetical protein